MCKLRGIGKSLGSGALVNHWVMVRGELISDLVNLLISDLVNLQSVMVRATMS